MKTFEYGHALRAHINACDHAQKILKKNEDIKNLEYHIGIDYHGIFGMKGNKFYPTFASLDRSLKFNFKDRFHFSPLESKYCPTILENNSKSAPMQRRLLKGVSSNVLSSAQVKKVFENYPE